MNSACVVVPIYKTQLNQFERISLIQIGKVFKEHHICFIAPRKYDWGNLEGILRNNSFGVVSKKEFDSYYFISTVDYSRLMLSLELYEQFMEYQFMLICQLDAFPFSDRLEEFCNMGFDYIGAPCEAPEWRKVNAKVGNGGFSLRKIEAVLRVLLKRDEILKVSNLSKKVLQYEDLFFGYCGVNREIDFRVPDVTLASDFAIQDNVEESYKKIHSKNLPFGCHGWYRSNYNVWRPIIESYGYKLPEEDDVYWFDGTRYALLCKKIDILEEYFQISIIKESGDYFYYSDVSIWGMGEIGTRIINCISQIGITVYDVFDLKKGTIPSKQRLVEAVKPVIICTIHDRDIIKQLSNWELEEGVDYIRVDDFLDKILENFNLQ